jgi:cell division protein FtsB
MQNKKAKRIIVFTVIALAIFLYSQYLRMEDRKLLQDLNRLGQRIKTLEIDNNMQKIVDLRAQNFILKDTIQKLQSELFKLRQEKTACQKELERTPHQGKEQSAILKKGSKTLNPAPLPAKGNRGYLFKK